MRIFPCGTATIASSADFAPSASMGLRASVTPVSRTISGAQGRLASVVLFLTRSGFVNGTSIAFGGVRTCIVGRPGKRCQLSRSGATCRRTASNLQTVLWFGSVRFLSRAIAKGFLQQWFCVWRLRWRFCRLCGPGLECRNRFRLRGCASCRLPCGSCRFASGRWLWSWQPH